MLLTCCGSIVEYHIDKGHILLEHAYPTEASPVPSIWIDVSLVLENTKSTSLAPGTWVNVIGYVRSTRQTRRKSGSHLQNVAQTGSLQAVLIWDAGAVRIGDYEYSLEEQRRVRRESELTGR